MIRLLKRDGVYILQLFRMIRIAISIIKSKVPFEPESYLASLHLGIHNLCTVFTIEWRPNANCITEEDFS
jgi:hypothetical protein